MRRILSYISLQALRRVLILIILGGFAAESARAASEPPADWLAWQAKRKESLAGTNGWTTLVGLHWLREGRNFAGTDPTNNALLPAGRAPASLGSFTRSGRAVKFEAAPGVNVTIAGKPIRTADLATDREGPPTKLQAGPLTIVAIERGERIGLRVRDPDAPARIHFQPPEYYAYDLAWVIAARFEPFAVPKKLRVADVTGGSQEMDSPGALVFTRQGTEQRLDVIQEPGENELFVIFKDLTAGKSTYTAGRFLYVNQPGSDGRVLINFNRAYSPPCAFTEFATCPLPPRQNWLSFEVLAGERKPAGGHH